MPPVLRPTGDKHLPKRENASDQDNQESNTSENKPNEASSAPAQQEPFVRALNRPVPGQPSTLQTSHPPTDNMSLWIKEEPHVSLNKS